jgi:alkaline phosphatase D
LTPVRRSGLIGAGITVAALAMAPSASADVGKFVRGVAAGEITSKSAVLWAQTKKPGKVEAVFGAQKAERFEHASGKAKASNDNTVQIEVGGLKPGTDHVYLFCTKTGRCSDAGEFTTAPKASKSATVEFAYTGDADGTPLPGQKRPFFGAFNVYRTMAREGNHFNVNLGDTIYSDSGVGDVPPALTTQEKWAKYRQVLDQRNTMRLRRSTGFYSHWDDHEFINDFSIPEDGQPLYEAGVRAFTDYAPVNYDPQDGLYRSFRWGRNLELFFLDERSFRSAKADFGGVCNNPQTGQPDLAPTAPPSKRQLFSVLIPSLSEPVSQACKDAINDPGRTLLGQPQLNRFIEDVSASNARFKVIMNETPIQQFYGLPYDRWEGYAHERIELLRRLRAANVDNLVFLTTDVHAAFANVVRERTFADDVAPSNAPAGPQDTPFQDFIIGPVGTNTFWAEIDRITGTRDSGQLLSEAFFKPPPPDGVGMFCAQGDVYSYGQVTVTGSKLTIKYKDQNGDPVVDVNDQPCGPYVIQAQ